VKKEKLAEAFTSIGLRNVLTFKQSGNVIFETDGIEEKKLVHRIEKELAHRLGFEVPAFVRSIAELDEIMEVHPFKKGAADTSQLVTFFSDEPKGSIMDLPVTIPGSTALILAIKGREAYSETHGGGEGGTPNPFLEKLLRTKATTRNINIIEEILEKFRRA